MIDYPKFKACAAHVAPIFLDAQATVQKACSLIAEAANNGAQLIAFPESFVPGFPLWASVQAPIKNHDYFKRMVANSIEVPGPEVQLLSDAAREREIVVSIGISERTPVSVGCLWNSNLLIGADGTVLNHHRKLMPTFYEKLIWASGDGAGLRVNDTAIGKIGMLICGENTNPLARYSLIAQGEQVHVSSYPPIWPTRASNEPGRYDLASAIRIRAGAHSFEGKVFNVVSSAFFDTSILDALRGLDHDARETLEQSPRAVSMVIGPSGEVISDTLCESEGLLYQDIDI
jgi:nitrilase